MKYRIGFVMEQVLGHVTVTKNLALCVAEHPEIEPTWIPIEYNNPIGRIPILNRNWSLRAGLHARAEARRAARVHRLEALLFHTQVTSLFSAGLMRSIPSIISIDATPINYDSLGSAYGHTSNPGSPAERFKMMINRRAFHAARQIVSFTQWAKDSVVKDYQVPAERVRVIPPGIDQSLWTLEEGPGEKLHARPRILFVGGDFDRKGGPLLLQVFRDHFRDVAELQIVTKSDVKAEPGVSVHREIQSNDPRLRRLFAEADVFVLPTEGDTNPFVIAEAMVLNVPVISTRVAGIPEMVEDGVSGLLFQPGDGQALRQSLETMIGDPALRRSMGSRSREIARERFDIRKNAGTLLEMLKAIARPGEMAASAG